MYTVLHIEQSEFFCKAAKEILESNNYEYIYTNNFNDAIGLIDEFDVDLIVTSLYAEGCTVDDFVSTVKEKYPEKPIFVVTGDSMGEERKKLIDLGIREYIFKEEFKDEFIKYVDMAFAEDQYAKDLQEAKIAVVEDSHLEMLFAKDILSKYNLKNIDYFKTGTELIKKNKRYDIYLIDIVLKDEFGKDVIRKLRRDNIDSTIIAVTGLQNPKVQAEILDSGANDIIVKPLEEELFIAKLKSYIRFYTLNKKLKSTEE